MEFYSVPPPPPPLNTLSSFFAVPKIESPPRGRSRRPASQGPFGLPSGLCGTCVRPRPRPSRSRCPASLPTSGPLRGSFPLPGALVPLPPRLTRSPLLPRLHIPAHSAPSRPVHSHAIQTLRSAGAGAGPCGSLLHAQHTQHGTVLCSAQKRGRKQLLDGQTAGRAVPSEGEGAPLSLARRRDWPACGLGPLPEPASPQWVGRGVTWLSGGCAACRGGWRPQQGLREEAEPDPVWELVVVGWLLLTACPPFTVYGVELFLKVAGLGPVEYLSSGWNL